MKICHLTSAHPLHDARILEKQCVSLAKNPENQVYLVGAGESEDYKNVHIVGIGDIPRTRKNRLLKIRKKVVKKALSIHADIYEFHDPELMGFAKELKQAGGKVIFDIHEDYRSQILIKEYIPIWCRQLIANAYDKYERHAFQYIDAVLYPEENSRYVGMIPRVVTIYNSPILDEFVIRKKYAEKSPAVCCVGSLTESRGITNLIDACYLAHVKLILGGQFSPLEYEAYLRERPSFSIVDYRGVCNRKEVINIYNEASIGSDTILPVGQYPQTQNLSTKVYEYMAMKMPYITSNFAYNQSVIDQAQCGISVDPENIEEISAAIKYLVSHIQEAEAMGERGFTFVSRNFSWSQDEARLFQLYRQLYQS